MTTEQRRKLNLLNQCRFYPGSWDKRFVRNMHAESDDFEPSPRQAWSIDNLYYRYRKQISVMAGDFIPAFIEPSPIVATIDDSDESARTTTEQLMRWQDKEQNGEILVLREKPPQTRRVRDAQEKLAKWNKAVKGS